MMAIVEYLKKHASKMMAQGHEWIEARELDQKRLDYLDANYTRVQDVYGRMANESCDARDAIDFFMANDVP